MKARKLNGLPYCPEHNRFECGLCSGRFKGSFEELLSNYKSASVDFVHGVPKAIWVSEETRVGKTWVQTQLLGWVCQGGDVWVKGEKKLPVGAFAHS